MENMMSDKKTKVLVIAGCIVLAIIAVLVIVTSETAPVVDNSISNNNQGGNGAANTDTEPPIITNKETRLDNKKAEELFNWLPFMYMEEFAPFTDNFMLTAAMTKVLQEEEPNLLATHVDEMVEEIFGKSVTINKANVSKMDISKSLYYYYAETGTYSVVPIGMESTYVTQLLKYATKDDKYTYVYTNEINGTWHSEEEKTVVVIGDKNGRDLVKSFDNYEDIKDYSIWQKEYSDKLPVVRYTLEEKDGKYILAGVEKINY